MDRQNIFATMFFLLVISINLNSMKLSQFMRCFHFRKISIEELKGKIVKIRQEIDKLSENCLLGYEKIDNGVEKNNKIFYVLRDNKSIEVAIKDLCHLFPGYSENSTKQELVESLYNLYLIEAHLMQKEKFSPILNICLEGGEKLFPFIGLNMSAGITIEQYINQKIKTTKSDIDLIDMQKQKSDLKISEELRERREFYKRFKEQVRQDIWLNEVKNVKELIKIIEEKERFIDKSFEDLKIREKLYDKFCKLCLKLKVLKEYLKYGKDDHNWVDNYFIEESAKAEGAKIITRKDEVRLLQKEIQEFENKKNEYSKVIFPEEYEQVVKLAKDKCVFNSIFRNGLKVEEFKKKLDDDLGCKFNENSSKEDLLRVFACILFKMIDLLKKERFNKYRRFTPLAEAKSLEKTLEKRIKYRKECSSKNTLLSLVKSEKKSLARMFDELKQKEVLYNKKNMLSNIVQDLKKISKEKII